MTRPLIAAIAIAVLALIVGVVSGRYSADSGPTELAAATQQPSGERNPIVAVAGAEAPSVTSDAALVSRLAALEEALRNEVQARTKLEHALEALRPGVNRDGDPRHRQADAEKVKESATPSATLEPEEPRAISRTEALAQLGMDTTRVAQLQKHVEELEMQQLVVRDKAAREGWLNTPRYADTVRKMPDESDLYRKELGDANYDNFLFRTGQPNRVSVQSVLAGSPAQKSGIESGDIIYSYADERVFNWGDLTGATGSGEPGQSVRIELVRNGKKLNVYVPRGPLGVRMNTDTVPP